VSPHWDALISKDYEYIMPLPVKYKYGLPYLVQPILTQQLGIFSKHTIDENLVQQFIKDLPSFSYELNLNEQNFNSSAVAYPNFILNLNQPYEQIAAQYSKNTKRNIEKSLKLDLKVKTRLELDDFLTFYYSVNKNYISAQQQIVKKLIEKGIAENAMTLYGVYSAESELIAALCILYSARRITYLLPISNHEGKVSSAMFLLIDKIIRKEALNNVIFDFEGSRIEGIARFYKGFGATDHPYFVLKRFRPSFLISKPSIK